MQDCMVGHVRHPWFLCLMMTAATDWVRGCLYEGERQLK